MAMHSSILAWETPQIEAPGRLQSMEFSRQEYWSRLPFPSPGNLPDPGMKPGSPALQADYLLFELPFPVSKVWICVGRGGFHLSYHQTILVPVGCPKIQLKVASGHR